MKKSQLNPLRSLDWNNPQEKRQHNRDLFDVVAPAYDRVTRRLSFGRDRSWKKKLIRSLPPFAAPVCLDIACGTGDLSAALHTRYPEGRISGLDLNPVMLGIARNKHAATGIEFLEGDMARLPFPDESIDILTGGYALRNAPELATTLSEIRRVLRSGGSAAFLDFSRSGCTPCAALQLFLLRVWGGFWGLILHGDAQVYGYIAASLARFPAVRELRRLFRENGLEIIREKRLFFGFTRLVLVRKSGGT